MHGNVLMTVRADRRTMPRRNRYARRSAVVWRKGCFEPRPL